MRKSHIASPFADPIHRMERTLQHSTTPAANLCTLLFHFTTRIACIQWNMLFNVAPLNDDVYIIKIVKYVMKCMSEQQMYVNVGIFSRSSE